MLMVIIVLKAGLRHEIFVVLIEFMDHNILSVVVSLGSNIELDEVLEPNILSVIAIKKPLEEFPCSV